MVIGTRKTKEGQKKITTLPGGITSLENYTRDLFTFIPTPIFLLNLSKIILGVNPAFEKMTGYQTKEIIGKLVTEIFDEKEINSLIEETKLKELITGEKMTLFTKKREKVPVSVSVMPREDKKEGRAIGFFFSLFNLSEIESKEKELVDTQKSLLNILEDIEEAKKELDIEQSKILAIINNLTDGILVLDEDNRIFLANPKMEDFFKVKPVTLVGKKLLELTSPKEIISLAKFLGEEVKNISKKELEIKENLILEVSVVATEIEEGKTGKIVILHDITREKFIEKTKTEFVSLAAHQLRTPVSATKWTLRMLLDGDLGKITKEQRRFIEKTYEANERMISLINDLLNITRIEEGRYLFDLKMGDLGEIVSSVAKNYQGEASKKKITLSLGEVKPKLPEIRMDIEKIKLAVQNFIENAIKYTPPEGKINISLEHKKKEKKVIFSIQDNGVGIPKDQQPLIFTKFFRGANVVRMDTEGTGLGLFITKNIIEAHGGETWFESEEKEGTTFYFSLPVKFSKSS